MKNQLCFRDDQINGLRKQLSNVRENHQSEIKAKLDTFNKEMEAKSKELELCKDQIGNQINDIKKNNSKLAKENEKLKIKNNSLKSDIEEQIELDKAQKEKIQSLQEELSISKRNATEAVNEKVIKLSQELVTCREKYNDSVVDCDTLTRKIRMTSFELGSSQKKIEELNKICAELETNVELFELKSTSDNSEMELTKKKLAVQSDVIGRLLKERRDDEAKIKLLMAESAKARGKDLQKYQATSTLDAKAPKTCTEPTSLKELRVPK